MQELPKSYDHTQTEDKIYKAWMDSGYFNPDNLPDAESREPFTVSLPPPNVTGVLHIGHAFEDTIQDSVIRYQRMLGKRALWVPGTDHAAIATQAKFEKEHYKKENKSRHDYSRSEFFSMIQKYALTNQAGILSQLHKLGLSLDWSRLAFTLDEPRELAVRTAFKKMYDAGLIYRGHRLVNWDPKGQTTVSDDEIEYVEQKDPFYYFKYGPFTIATVRPETKFGDKYVVMHPDDKRYEQYKHGQKIELEWINGPITATIIKDHAAEIEVGSGVMTITPAHSAIDFEIAQRHNLDVEQVIDERGILLPIAGEFAGEHIKKARAKVVEKLKAKGLVEKTDEHYIHRIATNMRGGGIIEPQIKEQWFVSVNKEFTLENSKISAIPSGSKTTLKDIMRKTVESKQIKIAPERFEKIYYHWIDNLRDWCISRQIIYGHQIPVWYHAENQKSKIKNQNCSQPIVSIENINTCPNCNEPLQQDSDTLDTWFSSGLWTFSTLGWPINKSVDFNHKLVDLVKTGSKTKTYRLTNKQVIIGETVATHDSQNGQLFGYLKIKSVTQKTLGEIDLQTEGHEKYATQQEFFNTFKNYYPALDISANSPVWIYDFEFKNQPDLNLFHPTSVMMPGYEILFFWVARMILMSGFLLGDIPFQKVYLHGIVRDKQGRKFSKSLNNGIDPLEIMSKYGTDALRMSLIFGAAPGNDVIFDEQKVKGMKHFANKLWNISRFVLTNLEGADTNVLGLSPKPSTDADKEILSKLDKVIKSATKNLNNFQLHEAAQEIYQFVWHEFADIYIEQSKEQLANEELKINTLNILNHSIIQILKLLHPFMPFVTEELWSKLREEKLIKHDDLLMVQDWPK